MKKIFLFVFAACLMFANVTMADSIAGKLGITAGGGVNYTFDSEFTGAAIAGWSDEKTIRVGLGWIAGGSLMYGITDNIAVDFDVIYGQVDIKATPAGQLLQTVGTVKDVDLALGAQWRFIPKKAFVPYIGAGLDIMMNKFSFDDAHSDGANMQADNSYGCHLSIGADYFFTSNIALNAEVRGLYGTQTDVNRQYPGQHDVVTVEYNPTSFSGFIGVRFFFPLKKKLDAQ